MIKPQLTSTPSDQLPSVSPDVEEEAMAIADHSDFLEESTHESVEESPEEPEKPKFQGIGTIYGKIQQDEEEGFFIKLGPNRYRLYILKNRYRSWLLQMKNAPDTPLYLRVYPKYRIIPRKPPEVYFQVVAWVEQNQWEEPGTFVLKGIWQFIPQIRTPVISVYRNYEASDPTEKFKAVHLPVLMRREDESRPFKFNPKTPKEEQPKRWFIQAEFKFIPSRDCWGWVQDLEPPIDKIPRYRKPIKPTAPPSEKEPEKAEKTQETNTETKPKKPFTKPSINRKPNPKLSEND